MYETGYTRETHTPASIDCYGKEKAAGTTRRAFLVPGLFLSSLVASTIIHISLINAEWPVVERLSCCPFYKTNQPGAGLFSVYDGISHMA